MKTILHVDMDAFFAAIEQHDHPEYLGKPVVIGAAPDKRGVVSAASYEARKFGIRSAMPSQEAGRLCPHAVFLSPNMAKYKKVSEQVFQVLERFTPFIEPLSIDEAFLDVSGSIRFLGSGPEIAVKIKDAVRRETGLIASVGVATNKFLAKIASDLDKPDGLIVIPSEPAEIKRFLAPLDIGRIWGVGKVTRKVLESNGYFKIGQLQEAPLAHLVHIVGENMAEHLAAMAIGNDSRELEPTPKRKSYSREYTFPEDCTDATQIERVLNNLVRDVGSQLRAAGFYGQTAHIKLRWKGFKTITRQQQCAWPICDDISLRETAMKLFREQKLNKPVRLIGFGISNITKDKTVEQPGLFDICTQSHDKREKFSRTLDAIKNKFGNNSISSGSEIQPE
ncbi:MAG: DNA polymerase IV [Lentisphaerae bacterium]|nr:DNA polymerase IV [Lentisphaerota bacterium]